MYILDNWDSCNHFKECVHWNYVHFIVLKHIMYISAAVFTIMCVPLESNVYFNVIKYSWEYIVINRMNCVLYSISSLLHYISLSETRVVVCLCALCRGCRDSTRVSVYVSVIQPSMVRARLDLISLTYSTVMFSTHRASVVKCNKGCVICHHVYVMINVTNT